MVTPAVSQMHHAVTDADYARAAGLLPERVGELVTHVMEQPTWFKDESFYYRRTGISGTEFVHVDPKSGSSRPLFDQRAVSIALSQASGRRLDPNHLPLEDVEFDDKTMTFWMSSIRWSCDIPTIQCHKVGELDPNESVSPDGDRAAFIRDYNLWVRDTRSGAEVQLTFDGMKDFGYATDVGVGHGARAILRWSPDSRRIATYQQDQRGVADMYLVRTKVGHPELESWKYPMPGDAIVPTIQRVIIDVDGRRVVRLKIPPDQRRTSHCYELKCSDSALADVQWSDDGMQLAFISMSRDYKTAKLRIADAITGTVRDVLQETSSTFYESTENDPTDAVNWRYLRSSNELIWFSQRDNWGHLYLYDATTGRLKNQITKGDWNVLELLRVDETQRTVYVIGAGKENHWDPYFHALYRVRMDGHASDLLTPENATHLVSISPNATFFVDRHSTPDTPQVAVLRDMHGHLIRVLEKADTTRLSAAGWTDPVQVRVKARDGKTDLYGLLFKPFHLDERLKYPVVVCIYPGPHLGSVGPRDFGAITPQIFCTAESLAALGVAVVAIDGMGTPLRSKAFQDYNYGNMNDNTLPDQIVAIHQLAGKFSWLDLGHVGITGMSGGGYATTEALLRYPEVFKVGVSIDGNQDQRGFASDWGEKYIGLLSRNRDGSSNYDSSEAENYISSDMKGNLLLIHGTLDDNVPPYLTLLVVQALINANKNFDMLMLPNEAHIPSGKAAAYVTRRRWDYFVRHLIGSEPPPVVDLNVPTEEAQDSSSVLYSR